MEKLKERWEFIVGYVALIVSLSAFKDELSKIEMNLGFASFNVAQFLFILILGFLITLHLYLVPFLFSSTKYADKKIFSWLESLIYFIFVLFSMSPFFVLVAVFVNNIINYFHSIPSETKTQIGFVVSLVVGVFLGIISKFIADKYKQQKYSTEEQELKYLEVINIEKAHKLLSEGQAMASMMNAVKSLSFHLRRLIIQKGISFRSNEFQEIFGLIKKHKILSEGDINEISSIIRLPTNFTKTQAEDAISFIKQLIIRSANINAA